MAFTEDSDLQTFTDPEDQIFLPLDTNGDAIWPASIKIIRERPNIRSTNASHIQNVRSLGYARYRFEVEYAPMTKEDAGMLMGMFEKMKGSQKAFKYPIMHSVFNSVANIQKTTKTIRRQAGRTMLAMPVFETYNLADDTHTGWAGDDEFMLCDAIPQFFPSNLIVEFDNHDAVYKTIRPAYREYDLRVLFKLDKPLEADIDQAAIVMYTDDYLPFKVRLEEDTFEYGTNGAGLVVIKFDLVEEL